MPKFEITSEHDLRDPLQQIGVRQIFRDGGLRGVVEGAETAGYIGLWTQQTTLRVDARGTEAAAGSAITAFVLDYGTVQMRVDRPFLFAIVHEPTGLILFMGVVHAPPATARR
jgi:serpin B